MKTEVARRLLRAAERAAGNAYAPYSHYAVGAAVLGPGGRIFAGCNVENASYGLTMCAERNALGAAVAAGCREPEAVAIVADGEAAPYPCGACRQVLAELLPADAPVLVARAGRLGEAERLTLGALLPHAFHLRGGR